MTIFNNQITSMTDSNYSLPLPQSNLSNNSSIVTTLDSQILFNILYISGTILTFSACAYYLFHNHHSDYTPIVDIELGTIGHTEPPEGSVVVNGILYTPK